MNLLAAGVSGLGIGYTITSWWIGTYLQDGKLKGIVFVDRMANCHRVLACLGRLAMIDRQQIYC